jgi:hypothetical protein
MLVFEDERPGVPVGFASGMIELDHGKVFSRFGLACR